MRNSRKHPPSLSLHALQHREAARILGEKGLRGLKLVVDEGGGHHEGAWGWRLSGALLHLFHGRRSADEGGQ